MKSAFNTFVNIFASFRLSCLIFLFLFISTLLGTIEQKDIGIFQAQDKYFNSSWFLHDFKYFSIPLPGVYLLLVILFINNIVGSIKRIPWKFKKLGVWITHAGIIILLLGSLITSEYSSEGHLTVLEGETSNEIISFHNWELAIIDTSDTNHDIEYVFPLSKNSLPENYIIKKKEIPFSITINDYYTNALVKRFAPMFPTKQKAINGYYISPQPTDSQSEANFSGAYVTIADNEKLNKEFILWGRPNNTTGIVDRQNAVLMNHKNKVWAIYLRKITRIAPFHIQLDKFTKEVYPGTNKAKSYKSHITKISGDFKSKHEIFMNTPLRDQGYIMFQTSFIEVPKLKKYYSTFTMVQNPTDHVPLIACIIISVGMLFHFIFMLITFMKKENKREQITKPSQTINNIGIAIALLLLALPLKSYFKKSKSDWDTKTINTFKSLPIQVNGRVKPLGTYADFLLLKLNGKRKITISEDKNLTSMEWLLTTMFYPEVSKTYELFLIDDTSFLETFGLNNSKKRKRYSYNDLNEILEKLTFAAMNIYQKNKKDRLPIESKIMQLAFDLQKFEKICGTFNFTRTLNYKLNNIGIDIQGDPQTIFFKLKQYEELVQSDKAFKDLNKKQVELFHNELNNVGKEVLKNIEYSQWLTIFPSNLDIWLSPPHVLLGTENEIEPDKTHGDIYEKIFHQIKLLINKIELKTEKPADFQVLSSQLDALIYSLPEASDNLLKINLETSYYKLDLIYNGLLLYLLIFILISFNLVKNNKSWSRINYILTLSPTFMLAMAILIRCIIMSRPPITSLYETIIFITLFITLMALFIETIFKNHIALYACNALGAIGLFMSYKYELGDAVDTMGQLEAVLNSNFWLATHVTAINIGYASGLLAAGLAHLYLFIKVFKLSEDKKLFASIYKIIYGVVCFSIIFSLVGTVLGGIWANYSWGRFWGWDPKENGALGICLWILMMLHGRLGGIFKEFGMAIMTVCLGMVIVASWFGVNLLNTGLHSYGFTEGVEFTLYLFWIFEASLIVACLTHNHFEKMIKKLETQKNNESS
ncbi:MAG: hypothetical protein COA79_13030 [Planctomycetota bacterium]|nr:MAG: hypothetical protein COA79_13030 [Planctomycetota bacterium]